MAGQLYVTDTYNNKIKVVNAETGEAKTIAGDGEPGSENEPSRFDEPSGISHAGGILYIADTNNHVIRTLEIAKGKVGTLTISGLPGQPAEATVKTTGAQTDPQPGTDNTAQATTPSPGLAKTKQEQVPLTTVKAADGKVTLHIALQLPAGWKINPDAPMAYQLDSAQASGPVDRQSFGKHKLEKPITEFDVSLPVKGEGEDSVSVALRYYYCEDVKNGEGTCKIGNVTFAVPLKVAPDGASATVELKHQVEP